MLTPGSRVVFSNQHYTITKVISYEDIYYQIYIHKTGQTFVEQSLIMAHLVGKRYS
jgi:hypothetical protein